ncbi:MAG: SpoIIE family protein phosphatase, partial [bacterium]
MFKKVKKKELKVPADIGNLGEMRDFITKVGRKYGVSENIINSFKMAIDEAGTNIIRHAYRDWEGFITVRMIIREQSVTVSLIDQGKTFDPRKVKNPDLDRYVNIGKKGGLGIFIMRKVIDTIDYRKTVEGNELRLTKNRELEVSRRFSLPELSFSMKTRYSLIASGILSCFILVFSIWNYIYQGRIVYNSYISQGTKLASTVIQNSAEYLAKEATWELARISAELQHNHTPLVSEIIIVDSTGTIQGAVNTENLLKQYRLPRKYRQKSDNVFVYDFARTGKVYDIIKQADFEVDDEQLVLGSVHIMLNKRFVDSNVAQRRESIFWRSLVILVSGCIGVFMLVYTTMSPFRKLSHWVKALGRGEAQDVMEFDNSDEVGEIAQAFNDITEKFRETQEHLAEQERLQKEVQVAQDIQQTLLPASFPDIEGYEIATYYEAAKEVGGDYFDFVEVDKDTLGIVVADVSGKGVPGSLVMTMIRTALRTEARANKDAADVLAKVNSFVIKDMKRGMFVTIFYVILDSKNRTINYASAGHNPMILYRGSTKKSYYLNPKGFPIGIKLPDAALFNKTIESDTLHLRPEDSLIVYTDGITEAMNHNRERFGDERFLSVIREYGDLNVEPFVNKIRDEIIIFSEGFAQTDDITLVAIREKLRAEDVLFNHRLRLMKLVDEKGLSVKEACKKENVSTSTYYKYRKKYQKSGVEGLRGKGKVTRIEEKHISIEDRAKIIDIIKNNPDLGAKRISEELKTDKYDKVDIDEKRIYDELVKSRLNTKELRMAFMEKGDSKRFKRPGTPFVSLDGKILTKSTLIVPPRESEEK